jgi:hypothetical protein
MERADWVCSAAASSVACQGEMWTLRRLASERSMPTPRRSGRSDYRTCGVSVGWKASRSLLIVQLRRSNNVRLPCAVAASPQAVHVGDLGRRGADVSPVLNDFRHPLSLIYSLAPTYDPSRWTTMLKARPAEPKYTLDKGQIRRGLLARAFVPNGVAPGRSINEGFRSSDHGFRHSPGRGSCKRGARRFWRSMGRSHGHRGRSVRCELQLFDCRR